MSGTSKRKWHLIRENIKFQIKLTLDAVRDLLLSPVAVICTVLDIIKGNSLEQGHYQRLMQWGHNTDHWLNLFGDLPIKTDKETSAEGVVTDKNQGQAPSENNASDSVFSKHFNNDINRVDGNLDKLFGKIEKLLDEQQQKGGLTATTKQRIESYLADASPSKPLELPEVSQSSVVEGKVRVNQPSVLKKEQGTDKYDGDTDKNQ